MKMHSSWERSKLTDYQNKKAKEIVKYAYESVPFYHEIFKRSRIGPNDIKNVNDLNKLPLVGKEDIQRNTVKMVSREYDADRLKKVITSGSSGQPLTIHLSQKEDEFRKAKHLRANLAVGQRARDRYVVITGPQHFSETPKLQKLLGVYVATPVSVFENETAKVATIQRLNPDVLDGYSSSLFLLAQELERVGTEKVKPRLIIGGGELIDYSQRNFIEKTLQAQLYDQYACSELERLAWQCKEKVGYHIDADSVIMQFVDEDGEEVAAGETGEIVCTSLFNKAMPFIRYAVGDVGAASEEKCPCGRVFPLMKLIEGRKDSLVVLPNGQVITPHVLCLNMERFQFFDRLDQYRIIQKKIDALEIQLKMRAGMRETLVAHELATHFRNVLNLRSDDMTFDIRFVDEIPLDKTGKLSTVVSEL